MIKLISAGEIERGMLIMAYECLQPKVNNRQVISMGGEFEIEEPEEKEKFEVNMFPWYKGVPLEVVGVAGPVVMVKTYSAPLSNGTRMNPVMVFDSRVTHFMEVEKDYFINFYAVFGINVNPKEAEKVIEVKEENKTEKPVNNETPKYDFGEQK